MLFQKLCNKIEINLVSNYFYNRINYDFGTIILKQS